MWNQWKKMREGERERERFVGVLHAYSSKKSGQRGGNGQWRG